MEVHNLSIDDNEADTSTDDFDDEEHDFLFEAFLKEGDEKAPTTSTYIRPETSVNSATTTIFTTPKDFQRKFCAWERPSVAVDTFFYSSSVLQEQPDPFQFFLLDTVSTVSSVKHPGIKLDLSVQQFPLHNVIRLFGVTAKPKTLDDGFFDINECTEFDKTSSISVCCNVHGFLPYFYMLPISTTLDDVNEEEYWRSEKAKNEFESLLNEKIRNIILDDISCIEYHDFVSECGKCVARVETVTACEEDGIYHFFESKLHGTKGNTILLKVYCSLPRFIWSVNSTDLIQMKFKDWKFQYFETNINNTIRFLTDRNITGSSWYELKGGQYFLRNCFESPVKESYSQIEIDVHYDNIFQLEYSHSRYKFNPAVRVLSFDIEVMTSSNEAASPSFSGSRQVIQIGAVLGNYYAGADAKDCIIGKAVFVIGTCDDLPDAQVVQFYVKEEPEATGEKYLEDAEDKLLGAWRDFIVHMDPDIITGYNIKNFDFPYLFDRAFGLEGFGYNASAVLPFMGRLKKIKSQMRNIQSELKKVHQYDVKYISIQGRIVLDLYPIVARHDKLHFGRGYYKLSSVAKRYLNKKEEKQDVHYTEIESLQHGTSATRNRMARYCLQDSMIPYLLLFEPVPCRPESVRYLDHYFAKSREGGAPVRYLLNKSLPYNEYFKQIRVQKNPGRAKYIPETPSPTKPLSRLRRNMSMSPGSPNCKYYNMSTPPRNRNKSPGAVGRNPSKILFRD